MTMKSLGDWEDAGRSVMEENLGPLAKLVSSLVEIMSLMKSTGPLNQFLILGTMASLVLV